VSDEVKLVCWDVDGTLLTGGQAGRLAFADAIAAVTGIDVEPVMLPKMAGRTDPGIALAILTDLGVAAPAARVPAVLAALEVALTRRAGQLRAEGRVFPGVHEALVALDAAGVVQTLVTGNVAPNARTKLAALGLLARDGGPDLIRLDLGAYGSDGADRDALVPVAIDHARAAGLDVSVDRTWVVGDTPRDLACARAGGVRCLLVATGGYPLDAVADAGADAALADLSDTQRVVSLLTSVRRAR